MRRAIMTLNEFDDPLWRTGVVEVDAVLLPGLELPRKVDKHRVQLTSVLKRLPLQEDLVDGEVTVQIELDPLVLTQHAEADRVPAAKRPGLRVYADIEMVVQQVVVGAIAAVLPSQLSAAAFRIRLLLSSLLP
mgnify:CR=1 FL=1